MAENTHINREKNDRLFKFIFGNAEHKHLTLELYNAINGTSFKNADNIEINTIEDAVYMSMKNDLSFILADTMNLYEQQSTYSPNMPIRMLCYLGMLYSKYIEQKGLKDSLYLSGIVPLPVPKLIVFYNGVTKKPETKLLKLSDSFPRDSKASVQVIVKMVNINKGNNQDLLNRCRPLSDYALFTSEVREYNKTMELEEAVNKALLALPDDSEVKKLILSNKAEVTNMFLFEYDEKETMEAFKEEGRREGMKAGEKAANLKTAKAMLKDGISVEKVSAYTSLSIEEIAKLKK